VWQYVTLVHQNDQYDPRDVIIAATIPYHLGHCGLDLPLTMLRLIKMAQCASPARMGRKKG